jgi:hypothetical protein
MSTQPTTQFTVPELINRKVWVLNRDSEPYTEEFRGQTITVPADEQKETLMPYLSAEKFLSQPKCPAFTNSRGDYQVRPKALYIQELTKQERIDMEGITQEQMEKEADRFEKATRNICTLCQDGKVFGSEKGLKVHMKKMHSDRAPVKDE